MGWTPHSRAELEAAGADFSSGDEPVRIIYPNDQGVTNSLVQGTPQYSSYYGDSYGGTPIQINTGNSAEGLQSLSGTLSQGFEGLYDMIMKNTDKNNAWSAEQAQKQMDFQERMNQIAMDFNANEAAKNRDWQQMMSNTAHQREIADLKAAGLNPVLSASGGNGAPVTSGATASGVTSAGAKADADRSANQALASIYGALISAQTQMANANLSAQTNLKIAEMQKEATIYGAALSAETARMNSPMQLYNAIVDYVAGNQQNTPSGRVVAKVESRAKQIISDLNSMPKNKMSYGDAKSVLANTKLGKLLGW